MDIREKAGRALEAFIKPFRSYLETLLKKKLGENWHEIYAYTLTDQQRVFWEEGIKNGRDPKELIDWPHLKPFTVRYKGELRSDFGRKTNSLPTWIEEIVDIRNAWAHNNVIKEDDLDRALGNMIRIFQILDMKDSEEEIRKLRNLSGNQHTKPSENDKKPSSQNIIVYNNDFLLPWFKNVRPHKDIMSGNLDESVFAANLAEVSLGKGEEIYRDPEKFFEKTYFTQGLKNLATRVIKGLNGNENAGNRIISLQTGFGGGKTHALITLYHLAKLGNSIRDSVYLDELIENTGPPEFKSANIAVFTNTTNDPAQGRIVDGLKIQTVWGELAYQLGGKDAYEIIRTNDEQRTAPKGLFKLIIEKTKPALILIDELADYCVAASGVKVGAAYLSDQTISFVQELSEAVSEINNCVLVATLPASVSEMCASAESEAILTALSSRLGRVGADMMPVNEEEIFEVIRRRLFEDLGDKKVIEQVASAYHNMYGDFSLSHELPPKSSRIEYRNMIERAYPFHPELIDVFRQGWAANHNFQRTRGILRILASVIADLWKRQNSIGGIHTLIHTSDVNFANLEALRGELKKLWGNGYEAVISADVAGKNSNAFKIDNHQGNIDFQRFSIAQGVAATILLGTFEGSNVNKGMTINEIKLCVLKPDSFNHNNVNSVIDKLEAEAHYLYYSSTSSDTARRYWFYTKPNVNILINQLKNEIQLDEINTEILNRINSKVPSVNTISVLVSPSKEIPEQKKPVIIIVSPDKPVKFDSIDKSLENFIKTVSTAKGNTERVYRNTILFLAAAENGIQSLNSNIREYLACQKVRIDYKEQLETAQLQDIRSKIDELNSKINKEICVAYNVVLKYSKSKGIVKINIRQFANSFDEYINNIVIKELKEAEILLDSVGLGLLRKNNLLPTEDTPVKVKDIYEAFLRFDDKPMITGQEAIRDSLLRYCNNGIFAIASGEEKDKYTQTYYKETVPFFDVTDSTFWLIDKTQHKQPDITYPSDDNKGDITPAISDNPDIEPKTENIHEEQCTEKKVLKSVTVSGKVNLENYSQIFSSFIIPLKNNKLEIEIKITGKSTDAAPITEDSQSYKIIKESARQLGLNIEETR